MTFRRTKPVLDGIYKVRQADLFEVQDQTLWVLVCTCGDVDILGHVRPLDAAQLIVRQETTFVDMVSILPLCGHVNSDGSRGASLPHEELEAIRDYYITGQHRQEDV